MKPTKEAKERVAKVCAVYGGQKNALYALDRQLVAAHDELRELRVASAQLTAALRDLHSTVDDAMCVSVAGKGSSQKAKLTSAMRRALAALEQPEPGTPILTTDCPCCGAELEIEHGDEPGDIGVVGTPADGGND